MHFLALMIQVAAIATPIAGIYWELRRDVSDGGEGGREQGVVRPAAARSSVGR